MSPRFLFVISVLVCTSCASPKPEDAYKGQVHWVHVDYGEDYDLGSVRRIDNKVIFNWKQTEDIAGMFRPLSAYNLERKQRGMPLLLQTDSLAVVDCRLRTLAFTNIEHQYAGSGMEHQPDIPPSLIPPNTGIEQAFATLCV